MTMNDRLEQYFKAHPNTWVDGRRLESVAGAYAWRSRVSDLRIQRGMTIDNRQRRVPKALCPSETVTISEYCYVVTEPKQVSLFESIQEPACQV